MERKESFNSDKKYEYWSEMARNIVWAHGEALLDSNQKVELYGDGVNVEILSRDSKISEFKKRNPLPIADVSFIEKKANITISEEDYDRFLREICRPENIDGHKAASYYIGLGVAYRTLNELLDRTVSMLEEKDQTQCRRNFLDTITRPLNNEDVVFIVSKTADAQPDILDRANNLFENIMLSDDTRIGRINILRYAVAAHSFAVENSDKDWSLWCSDDKDRAAYSIAFVEACTYDLIDQITSWVDEVKIAEIFYNNTDYSKIVDTVDEMVIAGSLPMSSKEMNEILKFIN